MRRAAHRGFGQLGPRPAETYTITVDKTDGTGLGLVLNHAPERALTVKAVGEGLLGDWNRASGPELQVRAGDRIVEVNDVKDSAADLIEECKKNKPLTLKFTRQAGMWSAQSKLLLALAVLLAALGLAGGRWSQPSEDLPSSLVCSAGSRPCPLSDWGRRAESWRSIAPDLGEVAEIPFAWFRYKLGEGSAPVIVHIGPMDLAAKLDLQTYKLFRSLTPRTFFVEPNPNAASALRAVLPSRDVHVAHSVVLEAAACRHDAPDVPFYAISQKAFKKFPELDADLLNGLASLDKPSLLKNFAAAYATSDAGLPKEAWVEVGGRYIKQLSVRCLQPATLLKTFGLDVFEVDALILDAQGLELELLEAFMRLPGFLPILLQFKALDLAGMAHGKAQEEGEAAAAGGVGGARGGGRPPPGAEWWRPKAVERMVAALAGGGYDVYQDGIDFIAVYRRDKMNLPGGA